MLVEQFEEMKLMPIFEINLKDYGLSEEDEYIYTELTATKRGLRCSGGVGMEWDEVFSLDEHLGTLFELWIESLKETK